MKSFEPVTITVHCNFYLFPAAFIYLFSVLFQVGLHFTHLSPLMTIFFITDLFYKTQALSANQGKWKINCWNEIKITSSVLSYCEETQVEKNI